MSNKWEDILLHQITGHFDSNMSCDECFDCADQMIEELLSGENSLPEDFIAHMRGCPACLSELESLGEIVAIDMGQDPAEIMRKLHSRLERVE